MTKESNMIKGIYDQCNYSEKIEQSKCNIYLQKMIQKDEGDDLTTSMVEVNLK